MSLPQSFVNNIVLFQEEYLRKCKSQMTIFDPEIKIISVPQLSSILTVSLILLGMVVDT